MPSFIRENGSTLHMVGVCLNRIGTEKTNRTYRSYHSLPINHPDGQVSFVFVDIEDATRPQMHRSLTKRRENMIGDAVRIIDDADRWNSQHPNLEPIQIPLDFGPDVEWRKAAEAPEEEYEEP